MLNKVFVNSEAFCNEEILSSRDKKALFSNVQAVQEVSTRLVIELRLSNQIVLSLMSGI